MRVKKVNKTSLVFVVRNSTLESNVCLIFFRFKCKSLNAWKLVRPKYTYSLSRSHTHAHTHTHILPLSLTHTHTLTDQRRVSFFVGSESKQEEGGKGQENKFDRNFPFRNLLFFNTNFNNNNNNYNYHKSCGRSPEDYIEDSQRCSHDGPQYKFELFLISFRSLLELN